MKKTNFHTHTSYCRHALGTAADYAASAAESGLSCFGISDHGPFPNHDFGLRMLAEELPAYVNEVTQLKKQYQSTMPIRLGLEIEYLSFQEDWYPRLLKEYSIDYLVLGEHFLESSDRKLLNIYAATSTTDYLLYASALEKGMRSGFFAFAAHPDLMFFNDFAWDENCEEACNIILSAAKELDFILEYNANGYRRGRQPFCDGARYAYPHRRFWKKAAEANIRTIINSDCHAPEQVWDWAMELAHKEAAALGLTVVTSF